MELRNIALMVLIFISGILSTSLIYEVGKITSETPVAVMSNPIETAGNTFTALATGRAIEKISPADHIKESQIKVFDKKIELDIQDAIWSKFKDTNSMDPFLDENSNGLEIIPSSESDINVGDIVSYDAGDGIVIHRVIQIGTDEQGTYFIMKGDNNPIPDSEKVRFSQIKGILVGIIY